MKKRRNILKNYLNPKNLKKKKKMFLKKKKKEVKRIKLLLMTMNNTQDFEKNNEKIRKKIVFHKYYLNYKLNQV